MRFVLFFVTTVGAIMTIAALAQGDSASLVYVAPITAVAGVFFLRNLRDTEVTRKNGLRAQVAFQIEPGGGLSGSGTYGLVKTHKGDWHVVLDRAPAQGDLAMNGVMRRGWVWLDPDGLPEKVKVSYAKSWDTWPVLNAAKAGDR